MKRLLILTYHRVLDRPDPLMPGHVTVDTFRNQIGILKKWFRVAPLSSAVRDLQRGVLPLGSVAVTFDDGYADNYTNALPILAEAGLPATFFIATGFLDGGCMWNDAVTEAIRRSGKAKLDLSWLGLGERALGDSGRRAALVAELIKSLKYLPMDERLERVERLLIEADVPRPEALMMTSAQVGALAGAGMHIGAHTVRHPILSRIPAASAQAEIRASRRYLEELLGRGVDGFAYPNGKPGRDYTAEHVGLVRDCGFEFAVSTAPGAARRTDDRYQLPRVGVWSTAPWKILLNMALAFGSRQTQRA